MDNNEKMIKLFNDFLDDEDMIKYISHYYDKATPRDCFNKEAIENIELNIRFFQDIPLDRLEDVFICLTEIFHEYDVCRQSEIMNNMIIEYLPIYNKKPMQQLNEDIKKIKDFKEVFSRIVNFTEIHNEIPNINNVLNRILKDLESKEFKIIKKHKYYKPQKITKTEFKNFFKNVRNNFNLQNVSHLEKSLVDGFTSYISSK